jgi:hypothetical protein
MMNIVTNKSDVLADVVLEAIQHAIEVFGRENCFIYVPNPFGRADKMLMNVAVDTDAFIDGFAHDIPWMKHKGIPFLFNVQVCGDGENATISVERSNHGSR